MDASSVGRDPTSDEDARRGLSVHGSLDLLAAALYAWLGFVVAPGRIAWWNAALVAIVSLLSVAGVGLILRRWRTIAIVSHCALLAFCLTTVALLVASAGYLRGVYGPVGHGMSILSVLAAALVVEAFGLLPIFQLRFLWRKDVRAVFRRRDRGRQLSGAMSESQSNK